MKVYYKETVLNGYQVYNVPDEIESDFEEILKERFSGNVWAMAEAYKGMYVELEDSCVDFIDTDYQTFSLS